MDKYLRYRSRHYSWVFLLSVVTPLLLIIFIPKPNISGSQFIIFPIIFIYALIVLLEYIRNNKGVYNSRLILPLLFILFTQAFLTSISEFVNAEYVRSTSIVNSFRPVLLVTVFLLGLHVSRGIDGYNLKLILYRVACVILLVQVIIGISQAFNMGIFDYIYSTQKTRGIGGIMRVTGSFSNPNTFALVLTKLMLAIYIFGRSKIKFLFVGIALFLILLSGSRSFLMVAPFILLIASFLSIGKLNLKSFLKGSIVAVLIISIVYYLLTLFGDIFIYQAQLLTVFTNLNFSEIHTFSTRMMEWEAKWNYFLSSPNQYKWIIGLGSIPQFRVGDNDLFYVIWHSGILGLIVHLILYVYLVYLILKINDTSIRSFNLCLLIVFGVVGLTLETLSAWFQPLLFFYMLGLSIGYKKV